MNKIFLNILGLVFSAFSFLPVHAQEIEYIKIPELEKILKNQDNKLYVVNFWATWCAPCVKEMPVFEEVSKEYSSKEVQFIMISLDFPSQVKDQLIPFLKKNNVKLKVAVMTDLDYNSWIEKVDPSWQGDIPATLVFNNIKKKRDFKPGALDEPGLRKMINNCM